MRARLPDPADTWTDDDARVVLDECRRSGKSMASFARQHGVTVARLYWWKKRLQATAPASMVSVPTLSLVPAAIVETGATVMIRLPGGVAVEIASASPSWVAALVVELTRSS